MIGVTSIPVQVHVGAGQHAPVVPGVSVLERLRFRVDLPAVGEQQSPPVAQHRPWRELTALQFLGVRHCDRGAGFHLGVNAPHQWRALAPIEQDHLVHSHVTTG